MAEIEKGRKEKKEREEERKKEKKKENEGFTPCESRLAYLTSYRNAR